MCGRRRQNRCCDRRQGLRGGLLQTAIQAINQSNIQPTPQHVQSGQVTGVVTGLTRSMNDVKLSDNQMINTQPPMYTSETKDGFLPEPPAYTEQPQPTIHHRAAAAAPPPPPPSENPSFMLAEFLQKSTSSDPRIALALNNLNQTLNAYRGGMGRKFPVKRARKALLNELYEAEIERREMLSGGAYLRCGEKSAIWRELTRGLGEQIWTMIEGARSDRTHL